MTPIQAADPASKTIYTFTDVGALHNAIKEYHYIPLRADGSPFEVQYLQEYDGYLLDGAPLNVWMDGVWLEGQKEALASYWNSGQVRQPPANILQAGAVPMPPEVAERTAAARAAATGGGLFGMDTGTLLALGAGVAAIWWISRR
jgi:hypothetical protein